MRCQRCGSDNQEDSQFCRMCGSPISAPQATDSTAQEMDTDVQEKTSLTPIPEDAIVILQSQWAYMLYVIPLLVLFGISLTFDFLTLGLLPAGIAIYIIGSRYLSFRRTAYILTEEHLIIIEGSLMGRKRMDFPLADLKNIRVQPGMFGRSLGYTGVILDLADQQVALLQYVPVLSPLLEHLRVHMSPDSLDEEEPDEKS